jgi:hypothetical protein
MVVRPHFLRESAAVPELAGSDVLSDVFDLVEVQGLLTGGFAAREPWVSRGAVSRPFKLVALVAGAARVCVDGPGGPDGPVVLAPGDVVLLNHRTWLDLRGGRGDGPPVELIQVSPAGRALLRTALPSLVHVRAATPAASRLGGIVERLFDEASSGRLGSGFAIRQNGQLLLLEVLRAYLEQEQPPVGWLR